MSLNLHEIFKHLIWSCHSKNWTLDRITDQRTHRRNWQLRNLNLHNTSLSSLICKRSGEENHVNLLLHFEANKLVMRDYISHKFRLVGLSMTHPVYVDADTIVVLTKPEDRVKTRLAILNIEAVLKFTAMQCRPSLASHHRKLSTPTFH